jgi:hypothetical protein
MDRADNSRMKQHLNHLDISSPLLPLLLIAFRHRWEAFLINLSIQPVHGN